MHPCRSPTPTDLTSPTRTQTFEQEGSDLTASNRGPSTPHSRKTHTVFHEEHGLMLSRGWQNVCRFWHTPTISRKFLESEGLVCSATARTKTALDSLQHWFNYFTASSFKALGIACAFPGRLSMEMPLQLVHPVLSNFLCMRMITRSLPITRCHSRTLGLDTYE